MAMGRDGAEGWSSSPPCMVLFCLIPAPPHMAGKTFSPHPRHLGPCEALPHPVKLYFLLIFPTTTPIFLMKLISLIKIYLKLQLNLSHQSNNFLEKIEWYIQLFNKTITKKKKKIYIYIYIYINFFFETIYATTF